MNVRFSLDRYLERRKLTAYKLAQAAHGRVAQGSVYAMARGERVKRVDLESLGGVLEALEKLTGEAVSVADLLEVEPASGEAEAASESDGGRAELEALIAQAARETRITPGRGRLPDRAPVAVLAAGSPTVAEMIAEDRL